MYKEIVEIGGYIPIGGQRAFCVEAPNKLRKWCHLCAFDGTERCYGLVCFAKNRPDNKNVIFTIKLSQSPWR